MQPSENAAILKQLKLEGLNIPQRKANGIQSFSPPGHWLKSGFSQSNEAAGQAPQLGYKDALKPAQGLLPLSKLEK